VSHAPGPAPTRILSSTNALPGLRARAVQSYFSIPQECTSYIRSTLFQRPNNKGLDTQIHRSSSTRVATYGAWRLLLPLSNWSVSKNRVEPESGHTQAPGCHRRNTEDQAIAVPRDWPTPLLYPSFGHQLPSRNLLSKINSVGNTNHAVLESNPLQGDTARLLSLPSQVAPIYLN
jgi:hypothetical protein